MAIFIDANVPIYSGGRDHPLKRPCIEVLRLAALEPTAFVTDAEVLQELLHRYLALRTWSEGRGVFSRFALLMRGRVQSIQALDVQAAAVLADAHPGLSARDLIHAAVMQRLGFRLIVTADAGFDRLPAVERLDPARLSAWRSRVVL